MSEFSERIEWQKLLMQKGKDSKQQKEDKISQEKRYFATLRNILARRTSMINLRPTFEEINRIRLKSLGTINYTHGSRTSYSYPSDNGYSINGRYEGDTEYITSGLILEWKEYRCRIDHDHFQKKQTMRVEDANIWYRVEGEYTGNHLRPFNDVHFSLLDLNFYLNIDDHQKMKEANEQMLDALARRAITLGEYVVPFGYDSSPKGFFRSFFK